MKKFDTYVGIDWTGAKSPVISKSIAVAICDQGQNAPKLIHQKWSRQLVVDYIDEIIEQNKRILIGIDCNFGYASEILENQLGKNKTAPDLWAEVDSICATTPNFFAGDFWQNNKYAPYFWTSGQMPDGFNIPKRGTEIQCAAKGYGHPESPFKMIGAKQVGKSGLSGMRMAHYLKQKHKNKIAIWPFDDIEICNNAQIVLTEIYPRLFIKRAGFGNQKIRNQDDLNTIISAFNSNIFNDNFNSDHDSDAIISTAGLRYLCGDKNSAPASLFAPDINHLQLKQEGWIFGVGHKI